MDLKYPLIFLLLLILWLAFTFGSQTLKISDDNFYSALILWKWGVFVEKGKVKDLSIVIIENESLRFYHNDDFFTLDGIPKQDLQWLKKLIESKINPEREY